MSDTPMTYDEVITRIARALYAAADEWQSWTKVRLYYKHKAEAAYAETLAILPQLAENREMYLAPNNIELERGDLGVFHVTGYEAQDIFSAMLEAAPRKPT